MKKVYVDNSSTSFPKAPGISETIMDYLENSGCNVNRGGYTDSYKIALEIMEARQIISDLFHTDSPQEVVFTPGITYSMNILLQGYLKKGDHVITSSMEHNSVMRPLHALSKEGITYDTFACDRDGTIKIEDIIPLIKKETKAIVVLHASNVCGTVLPLKEISVLCKEKRIRLIVDTAQTAGIMDIDASEIDALAFTGHKGLLGPQGIGGFIIKKEFANEIKPLITGGTGSQSHEFEQPDFLPDKYESGTMNIPAILGLKKAVEYINSTGINDIYEKEMALTSAFINKVQITDNINIIGKKDVYNRVPVVSLDFPEQDNAAIATALDENYGIMTRCGLHCAPVAHKTIGTYPRGTIRFSFGYFNTMDEIEYLVESIKDIIKKVPDIKR